MDVSQTGTIQSSTPMYDPVTGQPSSTLALPAETKRFAVEAGYSTAGVATFNLYALDPTGNPQTTVVDPARTVSIRGGSLEMKNAQGQYLSGTGYGQGPTARTILNYSGNQALTFIDGIKPASLPTVGTTTAVIDGSVTVTQVTTAGARTTVHTTLTPTASSEPPLTQRKVYVSAGGGYVLEEVRTDVSVSVSGFSMSGESIARFTNVQLVQNPAKDAARLNNTSGATWGTPGGGGTATTSSGPPAPCDWSNPDVICPTPPPVSPTPAPACPSTTDGANLVFVHGINSEGTRWGHESNGSGVRGRSHCEMRVHESESINFTNRGFQSHIDQQNQLVAAIQNLDTRRHILIGHSQGGLISRRAARALYTPSQGDLNPIRGVVTIGTPHQGALIAQNAPSTVLAPIAGGIVRGAVCRIVPTCNALRSGIQSAIQTYLAAGAGGGTDAMRDLKPMSSAIQTVNSQPEYFPRFGIQHYVGQRWIFARVAGDTNQEDGGPAYVDAMNKIEAAAIASLLLSWWPPAAVASVVLTRFMFVAYSTNVAWRHLTAGSEDRSDGIVQGSSQVYPGAVLNREALNPTSHTGEMNTRRSYDEVEFILTNQLNVAER